MACARNAAFLLARETAAAPQITQIGHVIKTPKPKVTIATRTVTMTITMAPPIVE